MREMPLPILVNISDFRENLADYLAMVKLAKRTVVIKSGKSKKEIGRLEPPKTVYWNKERKFIKSLYGSWKRLPKDRLRKKIEKIERDYLKKLAKGNIK